MARAGKQTNLKKIQSKKEGHLKEDAKRVAEAAHKVFFPTNKRKGR